MRLELIATTTFGLEAVARREIENLGYEIIRVEDGKVTYMADERGIVRSNLWLRIPDRILLKVGEFMAETFEELFQLTKGIAWEEIIPIDGKFTVIGTAVKSKLHSVPACQSIVKKAIVERMKSVYGIEEFAENGAEYTVKVTMLKDRATLTIDTSGTALHKRGYRTNAVAAPLKETMAAALVMLSFWNKDRILVDACCGSGTIPIEAAMIGMNVAPGLNREFASSEWEFVPKYLWKEERQKAYEAIDYDVKLDIRASDINKFAIKAARENAIDAGVEENIKFQIMDIGKFETSDVNGVIITNPPYGKRICTEEEVEKVYKALRNFYKNHKDWSLFAITSDEEFENKVMGHKANRRRKLFNGKIKTCYYQFHGERV